MLGIITEVIMFAHPNNRNPFELGSVRMQWDRDNCSYEIDCSGFDESTLNMLRDIDEMEFDNCYGKFIDLMHCWQAVSMTTQVALLLHMRRNGELSDIDAQRWSFEHIVHTVNNLPPLLRDMNGMNLIDVDRDRLTLVFG